MDVSLIRAFVSKRENRIFVVPVALVLVFSSASQMMLADNLFQTQPTVLNPCAYRSWSSGRTSRKTKEQPQSGQSSQTSAAPAPSLQQSSPQQPISFPVDGLPLDRRLEFHQRGSYAQLYWPAPIKDLGFRTEDLSALPRTSLIEFSQQNADSIEQKPPEQKSFPKELDRQVWQELERARKPHAKAVLLYAAGRIKHSLNACEDALSAYHSALVALNTKGQRNVIDKFVEAENTKVVRLHELVRHLVQFQEFDESFLFSSSEVSEYVPLTKKLSLGVPRKFTLEEGVARYDDEAAPIDRMKKMTVYYWPKPLSEIGCSSLDLPILDDKNVEQLVCVNVEEPVIEVVEPITSNGRIETKIWKSLAYARSIYAKALILYMQQQFVSARRAALIAQRAYKHVHDEIARKHRDQDLLQFVEQETQRVENIDKLVEVELTWAKP